MTQSLDIDTLNVGTTLSSQTITAGSIELAGIGDLKTALDKIPSSWSVDQELNAESLNPIANSAVTLEFSKKIEFGTVDGKGTKEYISEIPEATAATAVDTTNKILKALKSFN